MVVPLTRRILLLTMPLVVLACTPTGPLGSDETDEAGADTEQTVPVPAVRLSPFCQAMIDLADELASDPPEDETKAIIDAYEAILPEVPDVLREDFEVVLADLRGEPVSTVSGTDPTTTTSPLPEVPPVTDETGATIPVGDPFGDEGRRLPGETSAERVNGYVDFACRGNQNNPGPPATEPLDAPTATDG